jgi:transketolase
MRRDFENLLYEKMAKNADIYLITGDLGYGLWDRIRDTYPNRFFNVGSSEMAMMGMAIGLAMEGKIPFVYSITPFAIYRPFEMIRNYLDHEKITVNIVGGGRDKDYGYLGFSHWAEDDRRIMSSFDNIRTFHPNSEYELRNCVEEIFNIPKPTYLNLKK